MNLFYIYLNKNNNQVRFGKKMIEKTT